jgi:hypothetical protein
MLFRPYTLLRRPLLDGDVPLVNDALEQRH